MASSKERDVRPLAAEASHSAAALLVSEGPPLPVGDALHLVMERVSLPGAEDLDGSSSPYAPRQACLIGWTRYGEMALALSLAARRLCGRSRRAGSGVRFHLRCQATAGS